MCVCAFQTLFILRAVEHEGSETSTAFHHRKIRESVFTKPEPVVTRNPIQEASTTSGPVALSQPKRAAIKATV